MVQSILIKFRQHEQKYRLHYATKFGLIQKVHLYYSTQKWNKKN